MFVRGTLSDATGAPVAGGRLYLDGVPAEQFSAYPLYLAGQGDAQTDAAGAFRGLAYSVFPAGPLSLRAALVRPGSPDTTFMSAGTATFRTERERPDTVVVTPRLP